MSITRLTPWRPISARSCSSCAALPSRCRRSEPSAQDSDRCLGIEKFHELIAPGDMLGTAEQVEKAHRFIFHPARRSRHYSSS